MTMSATNKLTTYAVIDPGPNVLLEVTKSASPIEAVKKIEEKMRGSEYVASRSYDLGGEESLDGSDPVYLVYDLTDAELDDEGLTGEDAGLVRAQADEAGVVVSSAKG
ncbi:hypothetical protein [Acetobacter cerevisiae]|uniref:Uncharacterized protein n=1 Tax=Acetobacter cerevisiae TaxID=178900 RepID=A0A149Q4X9_9PROT|nr:hypothetical protein [Acetobacter cerevisiae]KXU92379.1 hypothetical protein AD928_11510 [Acetobacter cerevisiae]